MSSTGTRTLRAAALAAACVLTLVAAPAASDAEPTAGPKAVVEEMVEKVLAILRNPDLSTAERRRGIEEIAYARFDLETMSRLVLRRSFRSFSEPQKKEYVREFRQYLANNYGSRIDRYDQEEVEIVGERTEPRGDVTVLTRIVGGNFDAFTVDYRLRQKNGNWLVIDVHVEGVGLVKTYGEQFKEVLSRGGPERLLKQLREKNADVENPDGE
jgi:phospholipid transport system substrate-binding protein